MTVLYTAGYTLHGIFLLLGGRTIEETPRKHILPLEMVLHHSVSPISFTQCVPLATSLEAAFSLEALFKVSGKRKYATF